MEIAVEITGKDVALCLMVLGQVALGIVAVITFMK